MLKIGSFHAATNLLLCPIAGYCDLAFRLTIRPLGGLGLASTDLVNPKGLLRGTSKSMQLVETDPEDRPLCIQLYGCEPDEMAAAAQWSEARGAAVIDINMGCPVDKVCKRDGGSALLRNEAGAAELARRVVESVKIPVTVKMRLGWDDGSIIAPGLARRLEDAGVAAITVHGRTAAQKFGGRVRHDGIARVVEAVERIPVIGNGDVRCAADARVMMERTGCAGVMIGRAALGEPWIFRDTHAVWSGQPTPPPPTVRERIALMSRHFAHLVRIRGERAACLIFRQRVSWYARHLGRCAAFREGMRLISTTAQYEELTGELMRQVERASVCEPEMAWSG